MSCPALSISNGHVDSSSRYYGVEVTITCDKGHDIDGESSLKTQCQVNDTTAVWSRDPGSCDSEFKPNIEVCEVFHFHVYSCYYPKVSWSVSRPQKEAY